MHMRDAAERLSIAEFVRIAAVVDVRCSKFWSKFEILKIVREPGYTKELGVQVDAGKGYIFWVYIGKGDKTYTSVVENSLKVA